MPTERAHGGAALVPIQMSTPAMRGLNSEAASSLQSPEWATVLNNAVFDSNGRAAVRKGWQSVTTTPVAGTIMRVHEYVKADGTIKTISSTDADIFEGTTAPASVEGTLGITEGNIKFVNLDDNCYAFGTGTNGNPSKYTGSGNFTTITVSTGTAPTGSVGTAAFGRLWCVDSDGHTIRYSAIIDETEWDTADGGGAIDMSYVWPSGQDVVTGIAELAGDLVIFGKHNTVIWTDGAGSDMGINPTNLYISDTIPGIGCVSQFAITRAKGDLWFLSYSGMQTLNRALQDKTTPTNNVSKNVQTKTLQYISQETDKDDITVMYAPNEDYVLSIFPGSNKVQCFDTSTFMEDGTPRVTEWTTTLQTAAFFTNQQKTYGSITGTAGELMLHDGYSDDDTSYSFNYQSGWLDFGEANQYLKFIKQLKAFMYVSSDTAVNFTLNYDFNTNAFVESLDVQGGQGAEFNVSEFTDSGTGLGYIFPSYPANQLTETEFGGQIALRELSVPGVSGGQFVKVGCNLDTSEGNFSLQSINLYAKVGRIA